MHLIACGVSLLELIQVHIAVWVGLVGVVGAWRRQDVVIVVVVHLLDI